MHAGENFRDLLGEGGFILRLGHLLVLSGSNVALATKLSRMQCRWSVAGISARARIYCAPPKLCRPWSEARFVLVAAMARIQGKKNFWPLEPTRDFGESVLSGLRARP